MAKIPSQQLQPRVDSESKGLAQGRRTLWGESELKFCWIFAPIKFYFDWMTTVTTWVSWNQCHFITSVQFSSVAQLCPTFCGPMVCSTTCVPVHHQLRGLTQTQVHWVSDAIQPTHPTLSPSPPTFKLSQHQGLFHLGSSSHQLTKVLEFQLQHQPFQWIFRTDLV